MSRVTALKKKTLQHKLDRETSKRNHALKRQRHPKPMTKVGNLADASPKRKAAWT